MSPPPGTKDEYSRGDGGSRGSIGPKTSALALPFKGAVARATRPSRQHIRFRTPVAVTVIIGALASAAVLVVAEFLTLYTVRVIRGSTSVPPVAAGTENHYALIPIAVLAVALVLVAIRLGDRWALAAVAALGLIALLIGLLHDLPDARRTGLVGSLHSGWVRGASSPNVGMYLETLGSVMLLLTAGIGLLLGEQVVEEAPESDPTHVPFGVTPQTVAPAPSFNGTAEAEPALPGTVARAPKSPPAKRSPAAPGKRSSSGQAKRTPAKGARSPSAKRSEGAPQKKATPAPSGDRVADTSGPAENGPDAKPSQAAAPKRGRATSAKRSPSNGGRPSAKPRKPSSASSKRSPGQGKGASSSRRGGRPPKV